MKSGLRERDKREETREIRDRVRKMSNGGSYGVRGVRD